MMKVRQGRAVTVVEERAMRRMTAAIERRRREAMAESDGEIEIRRGFCFFYLLLIFLL
jgi:hypothetical protein